jgi:CRP/FNR family transcriptional regulator, cyclic AMP receptor protein
MKWPLLADVPPEDVRQLLSIARRRAFARNEVVVHRGDPADSLHLIVSGRFGVCITTPLGETALIAVRGRGDAFGELALVSPEAKRIATVFALEPGETRSVYRDDFVRLRREHPAVNAVLVHLLADEVRRLSERLTEAYYVDADTRVRRRLVELAGLYEGAGPATVPLTQEALAEMAGTSRATVNRVLREEHKRGAIELARGRTTVRQVDQLEGRARL